MKGKLKLLFIKAITNRPMTLSNIRRKTNMSMCSANKIKNELIKEDLIEFERINGRSKLIILKC